MSFVRTLTIALLVFSLASQVFARPQSTAFALSEEVLGTSIRINVTAPDGTPLSNALVLIERLGLRGRTDATGSIHFSNLSIKANDKITATVNALGYRSWIISNAMVISNDTLIIDAPLSLDPTGTMAPEVIVVQAPRWETNAAQTPSPAVDSPQAAGTNTTPPTTIRVHRVSLGRVDTVDFKTYVKHVLPNEWVPSWPTESVRSGAMASKTYAWYRTMYPKYPGSGYDTKDTTADQVYNPNVSYASTNAAVDATWSYKFTRSGAIFQTQYCAGTYNGSKTSGQCGEKHGYNNFPAGNYMSQNGSHYLANQGHDWRYMLTFYYSSIVISTIGPSGPLPLPAWPTIRNGDSGSRVKALQHLLIHRGYSLTADGAFGPATETAVKSFQSANALTADGIAGQNTLTKLIVSVQSGSNNNAVRAIQTLLGITADGVFGSGTDASVKSLQTQYGLSANGIVGTQTWQAAFGR